MFHFITCFLETWRRVRIEEDQIRNEEDRYNYFSESEVVKDVEATRLMHEFLLRTTSGSGPNPLIPVKEINGKVEYYEVGIIQIDQAPLIPPKPVTTG